MNTYDCPNCHSLNTTDIGFYEVTVAMGDTVTVEQWECLDCELEFEVA